jgi:hypothetical protein
VPLILAVPSRMNRRRSTIERPTMRCRRTQRILSTFIFAVIAVGFARSAYAQGTDELELWQRFHRIVHDINVEANPAAFERRLRRWSRDGFTKETFDRALGALAVLPITPPIRHADLDVDNPLDVIKFSLMHSLPSSELEEVGLAAFRVSIALGEESVMEVYNQVMGVLDHTPVRARENVVTYLMRLTLDFETHSLYLSKKARVQADRCLGPMYDLIIDASTTLKAWRAHRHQGAQASLPLDRLSIFAVEAKRASGNELTSGEKRSDRTQDNADRLRNLDMDRRGRELPKSGRIP